VRNSTETGSANKDVHRLFRALGGAMEPVLKYYDGVGTEQLHEDPLDR
jgi:hypothetical protein